DFWQGKVVGYASDSYTTEPLEHLSSALLRFTPLIGDRPVLVGSDLHLSIGATEIDNLRVTPSSVKIELSNAGARNGSLTFYSKQPLTAAGSEGCTVTSVEMAGENLWQVNLADRKWAESQSIDLGIGE
ncbi:MAG: alpha-galactosidase, partial [Proteobacteria bacterium]|nr:alpha-galactosidase [Pseudomonadota bacterium]